MKNINTFEDFRNAIGKKFKVVDTEGKPFKFEMGSHDTIIKVHDATQVVEGDKFIAHYSACRFIQSPPAQFAKKNKTF